MDEKEVRLKAAELYAKLAESSRDRFKSRRDLEWRVALGLWTLFGGAAGVTITARTWVPRGLEVVVGFVLSAIVVSLYWAWWIPWVNRAHRRDSLTGYFWESAVRLMLRKVIDEHKDLPEHLEPREPQQDDGDTWPRMEDQAPDHIGGSLEAEKRKITKKLHVAQWVQIFVTAAFALLFIGALWSKSARSNSSPAPTSNSSSKMILEGEVEIEGPSRIKVGH